MTVELYRHLIPLGVAVRKQAAGVGVDGQLDDAGSLAHGLVRTVEHLADHARRETAG